MPKQVVVSPPKLEPVSPPAAPATPALPDTVDLAPWTDGIDLLPYIDLEQDTIEPGWTRDGTALITGNRDSAMVKLPVVAPEEYDLRLRITRTEPGQAITLVLTRKEHEFVWTGGAYGDGMFAFGGFQGNPLFAKSPGEAKKDSKPCFEEGRLYDVQLSVRNAGAVAYVEGKWVTRLPADLGEMRLPNISPMLGLGQLGLSTYQAAFRVDALQLREITGKAKLLRPVPAPATKPPTPAMTQTDTPAPTAPVTPPVPAPTDPVSLRLAELEKGFLAAYDQQVAPSHDAAVAALNTSYLGRLDRDIAAASQSGKLDAALALRDERNQMANHGSLPAEDVPGLSAAIKPLRATYRSAMAKLIDQRQTLAAPLYDAYDRALAAYQDELTRATQLDEAARIKAVRAHVASLREASGHALAGTGPPAVATVSPPGPGVGDKADAVAVPVAPPLPASQVLPPLPKASQDDIRALVDWMFRVKDNWISVAEGPVSRQIRQSA
ncbi:MAG: hypothetical protein KDL87_14175, partial [Verrucomicrobiae bacterium]|nr:hypothetical protein [Verrucomicrobiae bacterium]